MWKETSKQCKIYDFHFLNCQAAPHLRVFLNEYTQLMSTSSSFPLYFTFLYCSLQSHLSTSQPPYHFSSPFHLYLRPVVLSFPPAFHLSSSRAPTLYYSAGFHRDTVKSPISRIPYRVWHFPHIKRQILWLFLCVPYCLSLSVSQYFSRNILFFCLLTPQSKNTDVYNADQSPHWVITSVIQKWGRMLNWSLQLLLQDYC